MKLPVVDIKEYEVYKILEIGNKEQANIIGLLRAENPVLSQLCLVSAQHPHAEFTDKYILGASIVYSLLHIAAKPNKLPKVTQETLNSSLASLQGDPTKNVKLYQQIAAENPGLWLIIVSVLENEQYTRTEQDGICKAFAQFYDLLYRQGEADEMNEMFI